jgi:hypothetical protein
LLKGLDGESQFLFHELQIEQADFGVDKAALGFLQLRFALVGSHGEAQAADLDEAGEVADGEGFLLEEQDGPLSELVFGLIRVLLAVVLDYELATGFLIFDGVQALHVLAEAGDGGAVSAQADLEVLVDALNPLLAGQGLSEIVERVAQRGIGEDDLLEPG